MNTNEKGNRGLANVISDVINKGYFIFLPLTDTTNIDIIIANEKMEMFRAQVKYSSVNKHGVIKASTSNVVDRKRVSVNFSVIDLWAIYCPDTSKVYYVPKKELVNKSSGMELRVNKPKLNNPNIHFANDYLDIKNALIK